MNIMHYPARTATATMLLTVYAAITCFANCQADSQRPVADVTTSTKDLPPLKIGFLAPLTGAGASDGRLMVNGIKLYLEEVGYRMKGRRVELKVEDDEGSLTMAIAKVRKLATKDKVNVLTGVLFSPLAYAIAPLANKLRIPFVVCTSTADDLTQRQRSKWLVRVCPTSSQLSQPLGEYAVKHLHYGKLVTIGCNYAHAWEVVGGFHKSFEDEGGRIIQKLWVPTDGENFSETLSAINPEADAVFLALTCNASRTLPVQLHELHPNLPILASTATLEESILQQIGPAVLGAVSSNSHSDALNNRASQRFVAAYKGKYGEEPSVYAMRSYIAAQWINNAVDRLKGDPRNTEEILAALKQVDLKDSMVGPLKLDAYGGLTQNIYIRKVEKVNGRFQNTVIYTDPMVSQFWKSSPADFLKHPVFSKTYPPCTHCLTAAR